MYCVYCIAVCLYNRCTVVYCVCVCVSGRTVLKKKVKFMTTIIPVQTSRGSTVSADHVSSVYDGKTYSITFKKLSGLFCFLN